MIEGWAFWTALLLISLLGLFHGFVLLFAPDKHPPMHEWGEASFKLAHRASFEWGKRVLGLCLCALVGWVFTRHAILWMLRPTRSEISFGEASWPRGLARWDLLALGVFGLVCGCFLVLRPEIAVEALFSADKSKLQNRTIRRLWTIYVLIFGVSFSLWSLLPLDGFIRSTW